ncbi:sterol desaturase family protein [Hymenobacter sp. GOD-10R]|uniref:sterol desaturase family protein n=1 Tax=Hymenobacter sp. GOD-10R TaxID=3093922 RepID=UPI002D76B92F|nr:sterol desaturase family protein [Hymenobacter sp. GOD-10R]WRQ27404.1 sterol desaturase family protein [Hymenobacter sp. GOD-10R]
MAASPSISTLLRRFDRWATPVLLAVGVAVFVGEVMRPLRRRTRPRAERWPVNVGLAAPSLVGMRLTLLPAMVGLTQVAARHRWGLYRLNLPAPVRVLAELLVLDYVSYSWHRLLHAPFLWRFHRVHHIDLDMDLSTGWRFHAGEMLASIPYRGGVPALVGVRPSTLLAYEAVFEACTAFHHSNWGLPIAVERALARIMVTPRAHGIHHSVVHRETQSNFGVVLTLWDRLHQTLRLNVPQQELTIGVPAYPDPAEETVMHLLELPLAPHRPWARPDGSEPERASQPGAVSQLAE